MKLAITSALALMGILAIPVCVTAATVVVDDDLTCTDSTESDIQVAIGLAGSGGTVEVCDGSYITNLTVPHSLTLISRNGSALTKIEGPGTFQSVITVGTGVTDVRIGDVGKGFDVSSPSYTGIGDNALVSVNPGATRITVQGNNLHDPRDVSAPSCGVLISAGIQMTRVGDVVIADNYIHDILNPIACGFTSGARGIFVKGQNQTPGVGDITVERNTIAGVEGNRPIGINITFFDGDLNVAHNSITSLTDSNGFYGSNGIEIAGLGVDTDPADDIFGNSIDGVSIAIWIQGASSVRARNNTYTNLIAGAFGFPDPFNLLISGASAGNFVCANSEDASGVSSIDTDAGAAGNTCPLCSTFAGNFDCDPTYSCVGFQPPMNFAQLPPALGGGPIARRVKKNRVFPFRGTLFDSDGDIVTDLPSPPVLEVFHEDTPLTSTDITDDSFNNGKRTLGIEFFLAGNTWNHNLASRGFGDDAHPAGSYRGIMAPGGVTPEYDIFPTCEGFFEIQE